MSKRTLATLTACLGMVVVCTGWVSTESLAVEPVESGPHSHVAVRSFRVVADSGSFGKLHADIHAHRIPPPSVPAVDFEGRIVVAGFLGRRSTGGYAIGFGSRAEVAGGVATVQVIERSPSFDAVVPMVVTAPYVLATMDRGNYATVAFVASDGTSIGSEAVH